MEPDPTRLEPPSDHPVSPTRTEDHGVARVARHLRRVGVVVIASLPFVALVYSAVANPPDLARQGLPLLTCVDDHYEPDNSPCTRVWLEVGETQTHTLCDPDFVRFRALAGAHYVVETTNLVPGTDPLLELYLPSGSATHCGWDYDQHGLAGPRGVGEPPGGRGREGRERSLPRRDGLRPVPELHLQLPAAPW